MCERLKTGQVGDNPLSSRSYTSRYSKRPSCSSPLHCATALACTARLKVLHLAFREDIQIPVSDLPLRAIHDVLEIAFPTFWPSPNAVVKR